MKYNITSLIHATISTIVFIVALTLGGELSKPFKLLLSGVTGHHWVTKGVFSLIFYAISYALVSRVTAENADPIFPQTINLVKAVILGGLIIFGFYVWHFVS